MSSGSIEPSLSGMRKQVVPTERMADEGHGATDTAQMMLDRAYDAAVTSGKYTGVDAFIGGTGSGKSVTSEATPLSAQRRAARIILESHAENAENLAAKIDNALDEGLPVDMHVVIRDPGESYKSVVGRYERAEANQPGSGKVVPVNYGASTHEAVSRNVPKLFERFADDPLVTWHFIDNRETPVEAREVSADEGLGLLASIDGTNLRDQFNQALDNAKLTRRDRERFGEQSLPAEFESASTAPEPARYGDRNRVFTKDRAEVARESLRRKLNPIRLSAGIDPTALPHLLVIAGYHLEAGSIKFADWSSRMIADLGDPIKPHLEELFRRALQNVYWQSKRPGLSPDKAERLRNILAEATGQNNEPLENSQPDGEGEKLPWANRPEHIEAGHVPGTSPQPQSSGAMGAGRDIMAGHIGESVAPNAAAPREDSPGRGIGQWKASAAAKPPFPPSEAEVRGVRRFDPNIPEHARGGDAEEQHARIVHNLPDEMVIRWGGPIGSHGPDTISVNLKTGDVTLWDAKFRGRQTRIQESQTFRTGSKRAKAIKEAIKTLDKNKTLPPDIRERALSNLQNKNIKTRTAGFGQAKNSIWGK